MVARDTLQCRNLPYIFAVLTVLIFVLSGCATIREQTKVLLIQSNQMLNSVIEQGQAAINNDDLQVEEELYYIEEEIIEACAPILKTGNRFFDVATWFDKILAVLSSDKCEKKIKKITEEHPQLVPNKNTMPGSK